MPTPIYQTSSGQYSKCLSSGMLHVCSCVLMSSCCCSCHYSRWSDPIGKQWHRRRAGPADADHGQHCSSPARRNHPAVRPNQWWAADSRSKQPGGRTRWEYFLNPLPGPGLWGVRFSRACVCLPQPPPATSRPIRSAQPPPVPSLLGWSWPLRQHWVQAVSPKRSHAKGKSGLWKTGGRDSACRQRLCQIWA